MQGAFTTCSFPVQNEDTRTVCVGCPCELRRVCARGGGASAPVKAPSSKADRVFFTIYLLRNYMKAERPDNVLRGRQRMRVHLINDSWRCAACTESLNRSRVRHTFGAAGAAASPPFIAFISNDDKHRARLALIIHSDGAIREPRHGYQ